MKKIILKLFCIISSLNIFGQFVVSGTHGSSDIYYDYIPDHHIDVPLVTLPSYSSDSLLIDLNNDNIHDINIKAENNDGGNWYHYINCMIKPLNGTQISINRFDTCSANNPANYLYRIPLAKVNSIGDTIHSNGFWIDSTATLAFNRWSATIPNNFGYACASTVIPNSGYLGIKVVLPNDTLLGWIKISAIASNSVLIEDYACNLSSTSMEQLNIYSTTLISPNPFYEQSVIEANKYLIDATFTLHNSLGQKIKQIDNIFGHKVTLYRDNLPSGIYYLRITIANEVLSINKFLISEQ